jgi:hypothetical protein
MVKQPMIACFEPMWLDAIDQWSKNERRNMMVKNVAYVVVVSLILSAAGPAFAGAVQRTSVSDTENGVLASQQVVDAPQLAEISAGDNEGLAIVGGVFLVLILLALIAQPS